MALLSVDDYAETRNTAVGYIEFKHRRLTDNGNGAFSWHCGGNIVERADAVYLLIRDKNKPKLAAVYLVFLDEPSAAAIIADTPPFISHEPRP